MEQSAIERLEAKSAEEAIIDQIGRDFNLAPFLWRELISSRCNDTSNVTWV